MFKREFQSFQVSQTDKLAETALRFTSVYFTKPTTQAHAQASSLIEKNHLPVLTGVCPTV